MMGGMGTLSVAEIGHYALVLALALMLVQSTVPLIGLRWRDERLVAVSGTTPVVGFALIALAFARPGRTTRALRNPLLVAGLMAVARLLLFPLLWLGNRSGHGDCLIAVAARR